jgi:hypothetical protein
MLPNDKYRNLFGTDDAAPDFNAGGPKPDTPTSVDENGIPDCCSGHLFDWMADKARAGEALTPLQMAVITERLAVMLRREEEKEEEESVHVSLGDQLPPELLQILQGVMSTLSEEKRKPGFYFRNDGMLLVGNHGDHMLLTPSGVQILLGKGLAWIRKLDELHELDGLVSGAVKKVADKEYERVKDMTEEEFYDNL